MKRIAIITALMLLTAMVRAQVSNPTYITPGTNVTCTPLNSGKCGPGNVTINASGGGIPATYNTVSDLFNRSGSGLGANWTAYANTFNPNSGAAKATTTGSFYTVAAYTGATSVVTQSDKIVVGSLNGTTDIVGAALRINGTAGTSYSAYVCGEKSNLLYILEIAGATPTTVGTVTSVISSAITGAAGDVLTFSIVGQTMTCIQNPQLGTSSVRIEAYNGDLTTGYPGIFQNGDTATFTSFAVTSPAAPAACNVNIVSDGDSITSGVNILGPYTDSLYVSNGSVPCVANLGVPSKSLGVTSATTGGNIESMITTGTSIVDTLYVSNIKNFVVLWGGTNDIAVQSRTPAQVYADTQTYVTARHAAGWKVILVPAVSRTTDDSSMQILDSLLQSGTGADAIVNLPPSLVGPISYANTTLFQSDATHPTQFSQTSLIAPAISAAISSLH